MTDLLIGKEFSPELRLQTQYNIGDTEIYVYCNYVNINDYLPNAPNIFTITSTDMSQYAILSYTGFINIGDGIVKIVLANSPIISILPLSCTEFKIGSIVSRRWSNYDYSNLIDSISSLVSELSTLAAGISLPHPNPIPVYMLNFTYLENVPSSGNKTYRYQTRSNILYLDIVYDNIVGDDPFTRKRYIAYNVNNPGTVLNIITYRLVYDLYGTLTEETYVSG